MNPLLARRAALEGEGHTIVEHTNTAFVAVRTRFYWGCGVRISTVIRVRLAAPGTVVDGPELRAALQELRARAGVLDPSRLPRGFMQARSVLDVVLAEQATPAAEAMARSTNLKGMGEFAQIVLAVGDAPLITCAPIWGAAYQPLIRHAGEVAARGEPRPAPIAWMGVFIGLLVFWPSLAVITLGCCGAPLLVPLLLRTSEKPPQPAALPDGG